jgi:hypothetical protein
VFAEHGAQPDKLMIVKDGATVPDAARLQPYLRPLREFIVGPENKWQQGTIPRKAIKALICIDQELVRLCLLDKKAPLDIIKQVRLKMMVQFVVTRGLSPIIKAIPVPFEEGTSDSKRFKQVQNIFSTYVNKNLNFELIDFLTNLLDDTNKKLTRAERQDLFSRVPAEVRLAAVVKKAEKMRKTAGAKSRFIYSGKPVSVASQLRGFKEWLGIKNLPKAMQEFLIKEIEGMKTANPDFDNLQALCLKAVFRFRHQSMGKLTADEKKAYSDLKHKLAGPAYSPEMKGGTVPSKSASSGSHDNAEKDNTEKKRPDS